MDAAGPQWRDEESYPLMRDPEKSDPVVVAAELTNNASVSNPDATELVEPRTGTKRNADQKSTYRA